MGKCKCVQRTRLQTPTICGYCRREWERKAVRGVPRQQWDETYWRRFEIPTNPADLDLIANGDMPAPRPVDLTVPNELLSKDAGTMTREQYLAWRDG